MLSNRSISVVFFVVIQSLLTACGGDGGGGNSPTTPPAENTGNPNNAGNPGNTGGAQDKLDTITLSGSDAAAVGNSIVFTKIVSTTGGFTWSRSSCGGSSTTLCSSDSLGIGFGTTGSVDGMVLVASRFNFSTVTTYTCQATTPGANCAGISVDEAKNVVTFKDVNLVGMGDTISVKLVVNGTLSYAGATLPNMVTELNNAWAVAEK